MNINMLPPRRPRIPKTYTTYSFKDAIELIESKCGPVYVKERHGNGDNKVIFLPEAGEELYSMLSYGRKSPHNICEQKYIGLGHFMKENDNTLVIVSHVIELHTTNRTPTSAHSLGPDGENNPGLDFLDYYHSEYIKNEQSCNTDSNGFLINPFLDICGSSEFVLDGHTHPGLGCFFSQPDKINGAARAAISPVCIFVCDPFKKEMLGCIGKDFHNAEVIVYARRSTSFGGLSLPALAVMEEATLNPVEDRDSHPVEDNCPTSIDDIVRLSSSILQIQGFSGKIRHKTRKNGKGCLKIMIHIPKG